MFNENITFRRVDSPNTNSVDFVTVPRHSSEVPRGIGSKSCFRSTGSGLRLFRSQSHVECLLSQKSPSSVSDLL